IDLDKNPPVVTAPATSRWRRWRKGVPSLPLSVSERDPEVLDLTATTTKWDCEWSVEIQWTCGSQHGVLRSTDYAPPFRTIAVMARGASAAWSHSNGAWK